MHRQRHGTWSLTHWTNRSLSSLPLSCKLNFSWGLSMPRIKDSNQVSLSRWFKVGKCHPVTFQVSCLSKLESRATAGQGGAPWAPLRPGYLVSQLQEALYFRRDSHERGQGYGGPPCPPSPTLLLRRDEGPHSQTK